jgi:hypothetical protein
LKLKQERDVVEVRGVDLVGHWMQNELVNLGIEFRVLRSDFNHFINEHFLPLQSAIFTHLPGCECVGYFRCNPVPVGSTVSPTLRWEFFTIFPPSPPRSASTHSSSSNSIPSLWNSLDNEDDKGNEDFKDTLEGSVSETVISLNGGEEGDTVSAGGLGRDAWELFSRTGVRTDSL